MKLYTEEQVKRAISLGRLQDYFNIHDDIVELLTPIELPSDEEIEKETWGFRLGRNVSGFISGAKWIKQHILNQNK